MGLFEEAENGGLDRLEGVIEDVIFQSESSGYSEYAGLGRGACNHRGYYASH